MKNTLPFGVTILLASSALGAPIDRQTNASTLSPVNENFLSNFRALLGKGLVSVIDNLRGQGTQDVHNQHADSNTGGAVFTRWGRTVCPAGNDLVYKGYAAGEHYTHKGGSSNQLCLPDKPIYANYTAGNQGGSYIYGAEYESVHTSPNFKRLHNHDVPCAVCRSKSQRSVIMLPARNECLPGWRREYWGYLMGGRHNYASTNFVCMDVNAEKISGGYQNKDGSLLYLTESKCGSLPCPPYVDARELTCSVCTMK